MICTPIVSISQWVQLGVPPSVQVFSITTGGSNVFVGTDSAVYLSTDGGSIWTHPPNAGMDSKQVVYAFALKDSFVFAGTSSGGIFRSTDLGSSWQASNAGLTTLQIFSLLTRNSVILAGTDHGIFRSTNNGTNWIAANNGIASSNVWALVAVPDGAGGTFIFAGTNSSPLGSLFRSSDLGASWQPANLNSGLTDSTVYALAAGLNSQVYAATFGGGIFRSSSFGLSWQPMNDGLGNLKVISLAADNVGTTDSTVIAGTFGGGAFASNDNATSWNAFGFGGKDINALAVSPAFIFVGIDVNGGVWRRSYSNPTMVIDGHHSHPARFVLEQNYPNPFNPTTKIRYGLVNESKVSLKVYNIFGQVVGRLVEEVQSPGFHEVVFDAANLSSGVYFYKLRVENNTSVKKLVLLR